MSVSLNDLANDASQAAICLDNLRLSRESGMERDIDMSALTTLADEIANNYEDVSITCLLHDTFTDTVADYDATSVYGVRTQTDMLVDDLRRIANGQLSGHGAITRLTKLCVEISRNALAYSARRLHSR